MDRDCNKIRARPTALKRFIREYLEFIAGWPTDFRNRWFEIDAADLIQLSAVCSTVGLRPDNW